MNAVADSYPWQEEAVSWVLGDVLLMGVVTYARAGGGQVQPVEVVGEVAPGVDWAAVKRRRPDLVWRPQPKRRAVEAAAHAPVERACRD